MSCPLARRGSGLRQAGFPREGRRRAITSQMASLGRGAMIISFSLV